MVMRSIARSRETRRCRFYLLIIAFLLIFIPGIVLYVPNLLFNP